MHKSALIVRDMALASDSPQSSSPAMNYTIAASHALVGLSAESNSVTTPCLLRFAVEDDITDLIRFLAHHDDKSYIYDLN